MSTPLEEFIEEILRSEFSHLPRWVNRKVFMKDMRKELRLMIISEFMYGRTKLSSERLESFVCPFVSDNVDLGANGGMDGKYDQSYEFPPSLLEYLSASVKQCKKPPKRSRSV